MRNGLRGGRLGVWVLGAGLWLCLASASHGSSVRQVSLDELVARSALIFQGVVQAVEPRLHTDGRRMHSYVRFRVERVLAGRAPGPTLTLRYLGGQVGEHALRVAGLVLPEVGERGIYFVESRTRHQVHPLYGWEQGCVRIVPDGRGHARLTTRSGIPIVAIEPEAATTRRAPGAAPRAAHPEAALGVVIDAGARLEEALDPGAFRRWLRQRRAELTR